MHIKTKKTTISRTLPARPTLTWPKTAKSELSNLITGPASSSTSTPTPPDSTELPAAHTTDPLLRPFLLPPSISKHSRRRANTLRQGGADHVRPKHGGSSPVTAAAAAIAGDQRTDFYGYPARTRRRRVYIGWWGGGGREEVAWRKTARGVGAYDRRTPAIVFPEISPSLLRMRRGESFPTPCSNLPPVHPSRFGFTLRLMMFPIHINELIILLM